MAQNTWLFPMLSGSLAAFRSGVNGALENLGTLHSGATAPATTFPYMLWADTAEGVLKQNDAANTPAWTVVAPLGARWGWQEPAHFFAGISGSVNVPLWTPREKAFVKYVAIYSDTSTTGSNGSNRYRVQIRDKVAGQDLLTTPWGTDVAELVANVPTVISTNSPYNAVAADTALELQITKTGTPTSLAAAQVKIFLGAYMRS